MSTTSHLSFILKPSTIPNAGVGVFILHDVTEDTYMELFSKDFEEEIRSKEDIPEELQGFCLNHKSGKLVCPKFFNRMDIGNYLNHSENQNVRWKEGEGYFALRDIKAGEELFANYRELEEIETESYMK